MFDVALIIFGLVVFEVVSSIDNAVVNAQVLSTMKSPKVRRAFLTWGILFAVFVVRGLLPSLIVFLANPSIGILNAFQAMWRNDPQVFAAIEHSAPYLMMAGGMFLVLLFIHWLFMEDKDFGLSFEDPLQKYGAVWFYALASLGLVGVLVAIDRGAGDTSLMLAAAVGFAAFFIADGFKQNAEVMEERMMAEGDTGAMGDWAKFFFLEILDLTFSIDGVVGAFAFTTMVPLILIGNGIGAIVVRQMTIGNIDRIKRYAYLKNGAMYSIGVLGAVMVAEGFGAHIPAWFSPVITVSVIAFFLWKSVRRNGVRV